MITGWAGTGVVDQVITMPVPEVRLYYAAGGFPLTHIDNSDVPFAHIDSYERQLPVEETGVDDLGIYGWWIYFKRNDSYGSALVEFDVKQLIPLTIEGCPHVTVPEAEAADAIPIVDNEPANPVVIYVAEPECVGLAVSEEP